MSKICFVVFDISVIGGVERVTVNLANEFSKVHEVRVLSLFGNKDKISYDFSPNVILEKLDCKRGRLRQEYKEVQKPLVEYMDKNGIEIMIAQGHFTAFLCSSVSKKIKARFIFCDHGALMNSWNVKKTVLCRFLAARRCDVLVTLTERSKSDYSKKLFISEKKIVCIPNWIDKNKNKSEQYSVDSKRIICAGRLSEEKGFDQLIRSFALIAAKYPDWFIDIYGDGECMDELQQMAKDLKVDKQVIFCGMRKDISFVYKDYAFYAMASYKEGYPVVLLEAKYNRLPIVSFDILTGPREIIREGVDGILVPERNLEAFAQAMEKLIVDPELRQRLSDKSQENINEYFKESIVKKWNALLDEA